MDEKNYHTTGDLAKRFKVSHTRVVQWCEAGLLHPIRTAGGIRLFSQAQVDELAARRSKAQEESGIAIRNLGADGSRRHQSGLGK